MSCAWRPSHASGGARTADSKWLWASNKEQCEAIVRDNGGMADLWESSSPRIEDSARHTEEIIDRLFPGNPLLCCGASKSAFDTRRREEWRVALSVTILDCANAHVRH